MNIEGSPPPKTIQVIWGDYNSIGLSGDPDDNCIYSLHRDALNTIDVFEGKIVFVYDDDLDENNNPEVFGYVCTLEKIKGFVSEWRARPKENTWYRGPKNW